MPIDWKPCILVQAGQVVAYEGDHYRVLYGHRTMIGAPPDQDPTMFKLIPPPLSGGFAYQEETP